MNKLQALLIAGLLSLTSVSFASTFDFAAYADGSLAGSSAVSGLGEAGYASFSATDDGITVTATGTHTVNGNVESAFAYLDKNNAGLGVCSVLATDRSGTANQCDPTNDDNVTGGEAVKLDFGRLVKLTDLELADTNHDGVLDFNGFFDILVDGTNWYNIALSTAPLAALGLVGNTFEFFNIGGTTGSEFYINSIAVSAVPVPAAGILFASALLGAGAFGRRKKKQASVVGAFARAS